jgi:hypothetical protein
MKYAVLVLSVALLAAPLALTAQSYSSSSSMVRPVSLVAPEPGFEGGADGGNAVGVAAPGGSTGPLSEFALGAGISSLGIQLQAATNLSRHFNLRGTGSFFNYTDNFTSNGLNADAKLNLATAGAALDFYPFHVGFRLSPGVMFYNQNELTAAVTVPGGTSFKLNGTTYYSANTNAGTGATPVNGAGTLGLNTNKTAFTITTGWGNMIPRNGHFSVPFELGVAVIGAPTVNVNLGGWACTDQAQTQCSDLSSTTNPIAAQVQSSLAAQVAKWVSDLKPLNVYPIVSIGVAYSFRLR